MDANNSSNSLNDSDYDDYYNGSEAELIKPREYKPYGDLIGVCYIIICCLSLIGNSLLLYGLARFEDLKRVNMVFILCLAIFDLLFTLTLPFWAVDDLHKWIFGDATCKILTGAYFVGIYGSLILLTAMTVDRFFAIVIRSPWLTQRRRLNCARGACVGAWIISVGACLKDVLSSKSERNHCTADISQEDITEYCIQLILLFFLPLAIIVFCYGKILHTLMTTSSKQKHRTVMVVLCIVMAFIICWGPYHILMIIEAVYDYKDYWEKVVLDKAFIACRILAYFHCCVNPLLYMLRGRFKKILSSLVFCSPELRQGLHQERHTEPSHSNIVQQNSVVEHMELCRGKRENGVELRAY